MRIRKISAVLLAFALAFGAIGCGKKQEMPETVPAKTEEAAADAAEAAEVAEAEETSQGDDVGVNLIKNGDFSNGIENWGTYLHSGGYCDFVESDGEGLVTISKAGATNYGVQIFYDGFKLDEGGVYALSIDLSATIERSMEMRLQLNGGDYHPYFDDFITIGPEMQHFEWNFTMEEETDVAPRMCLNLGTPDGADALEAHEVRIDNAVLILTDDSNVIRTEIIDRSKNVNVNQVGFLPQARKTAVVRSQGIDGTFELVDESGTSVYTGKLSGPVAAEYAAETVMQADFSDFTAPGTYRITVSNGDDSYPFTIGADVYDDLLRDTMLMLYRQRCGVALTGDTVGAFAHPACHTEEALVYGTDQKREVSGGWHDAGDYGRYVVSGVTAVADLFLTYEDYPELWNRDDLGIPESGNGVPDLLDEAKYELDWLLKMQDPATGGVYHKVTCAEFPQFVMPEEETEELILSPVSNTATGGFAAVMAKASIIYKETDPAFAKSALKAAKAAYAYLEDHKSSPSFKNPEGITTGEYPDGQFKDEMYWAAAELLNATGEQKYRTYIADLLDLYVLHGFGWAGVGSYGNIAYLKLDESKQDPALAAKVREEMNKKAEEYLNHAQTDGYMCALGSNYCWGSNMVVCGNARQMLFAAAHEKFDAFRTAAYDQLSYLLGQNATGYCFVTGYGSVSPVNSHHRPSMATGETMTGMLVGGPDGNFEDSFIKSTMMDTPPAKCYADSAQSYSTNEVTIYWNTPFLYLLSAEIMENGR